MAVYRPILYRRLQAYVLQLVLESGVLKMDYKKEIIQMIEKIEDAGTLGYLHTFIKLFLEKWG